MLNNNNNYINEIMALSQQPQFSTVPIQGSLADASRSAYLTPEQIEAEYYARNPQLIPQATPQYSGELRPEVLQMMQQQQIENERRAQQQAADFSRDMSTWRPFNIEGHPILTDIANLPANIVHDPLEIGTGLVNMVTNPKENILDPLANYYTEMAYDGSNAFQRALRTPKDMYNFFIGDATKLNTKSLGKVAEAVRQGDFDKAAQEAKRVGGEFYRNFMDNPFIVSSILFPKATVGATSKTLKTVGDVAEKAGIPVGEMSRNVAALGAAAKTKYAATQAGINDASKLVRKSSMGDLSRVLRNTREGDARVPLNEKQIELRQAVKDVSKQYSKLIDDNALVSDREMASLQYVADTTGKTIQQARRELAPQLEMLMEGVEDQALRFENRLASFEKDLNSFNKEKGKANRLKANDTRTLAQLSEDELSIFKKNLTDAELSAFAESNSTIQEITQYLKDSTRDALTHSKVIDKAASNAKYQENVRRLGDLALETGDETLQRFYEGIRLADKGEIFTTTLAGADIPAGSTVSNIGRRFQGRSSSREFGTATAEAQAKAWKENLVQYVDDIVTQKVSNTFADNILRGTIDGETALVKATSKASDIQYINPQIVQEGSLLTALENVSKTAVDGWIPIDKTYVTALKGYLYRPESALRGFWGDTTKAGKGSMLGSGNYLGGNVLSGAYGTLMNETGLAGTVKDITAAIKSKGDLAKKLGIYREVAGDIRKIDNKVLKGLDWITQRVGGKTIRALDALFQNTFAEINAQRAFRQRGLNPNDMSQLGKMKLGELIQDVRLSSSMPSEFRIIPAKVQGAFGIVQPFINWTDTAIQMTYNTYKNHPYLAGMAAADLFGSIGLDKEVQNRLNLGVRSDRQLVTYKPNQKTGGIKEITIDAVPQMTALKLLQHPKEIVRSGIPVISPLLNAMQGRNQFGNLMKRTYEFGGDATLIYQNRRYKPNPKTGELEVLEGGMGDEILSTAVRNLTGLPNLWNRTLAPITAGAASALTGKQINYYQPYGQSIFGSFQPYQKDDINAIWATGDPTKVRTVGDILKGLGTYYESEYYPGEDVISPRTMRALRRQGGRQSRRDYVRYLQNTQQGE